MFSQITAPRALARYLVLSAFACVLVGAALAQQEMANPPVPVIGAPVVPPAITPAPTLVPNLRAEPGDPSRSSPAGSSLLPPTAAPQPIGPLPPLPPQAAMQANQTTTPASAPPANTNIGEPLVHRIQSASEHMDLIVNTSRIVTLDQNIPRLVVGNPDILQATPLSPNEIQIFAKKVGATHVNLFNEKGQIYSIDCTVSGDVRQLADLLRSEFPTAAINVKSIAEGHVLLTGMVDRPDHIAQIVQIAHTFFPSAGQSDDRVISNIQVMGVQQILLKVKVAEVSRTKLRQLGMDWANIHGGNFVVSSIGDVIANTQAISGSAGFGNDTIRFGIVNGSSQFFGFIQALRQYDIVKILAEPDLTTVSGRPAQFRAGGEVPYPSSASINGVSVSYRETGVTVDFLPIVLGNGDVRLEVRPVVRELDESVSITISPGVTAPGFTVRSVDTGVEMKPGQTLALAGLVSKREVARNAGFPWLADMPYLGVPFRRVKNLTEDIELLIIVTPELVVATDCADSPKCLPSMHTQTPNDCQLYLKGYMEVPTSGPCGVQGCAPGGPPANMPHGPTPTEMPGRTYESVPSGPPTPAPPAMPQSVSSRNGPTAGTVKQPIAALPPSTTASPTSANPSNASSRYNPQVPQDLRNSRGTNSPQSGPSFIGPVGYDVLN